MSDRRDPHSGSVNTGPARHDGTTHDSSRQGGWSNGQDCSAPAGWPGWPGGGVPFALPALSFVSGAVNEGVKLSYDLLQEQMNLGWQIAQQWTSGFPPSPEGLGRTIKLTSNFYTNLYIGWANFWSALFRSTASGEPAFPPVIGGPVAVYVSPSRRGRASCQLWPGAQLQPLQVLPNLWARDPVKPPLPNVVLRMEHGQNVLHVQIPDTQPPDIYLGVVCNRQSGEPVGTVAVQVWGA